MNIQTILVAVDFSPESEVGIEQALGIARRHGARLILLHVGYIPEAPVGVPPSMQRTLRQYMSVVEAELAGEREQLERVRERISGQGVDVSQAVIDAIPHKGICRAAEELGADLVVTGTHGRTGLKRLVLGSVAERVVRMSKQPVLVARPVEHGTAGYRRILVPTDFGEQADSVLEMALAMAAPDAEIDVLHCWQLAPMAYPMYAPTRAASELFTPIRDAIVTGTESLGAKLIERHRRPGVTLAFHQLEKSPAGGIQSRLDEIAYDLVVTGSHGRRGASRFLLGSVAEVTVRHAPCSVLVVRGAIGDDAEDDAEA